MIYLLSQKKTTYQKSPMVPILPHFPLSNQVDLLPTCFDIKKHQGLLISGRDMRTIEYSGYTAISSIRRERGFINSFNSGGRMRGNSTENVSNEILLKGNATIPLHIDYYFEVRLLKGQENTPMSIGLSPEGKNSWGDNSYHYQTNRMKTWFVNGAKRQENYGQSFQSECVIGCGWNAEIQTIYFTKDGEDLGPAFNNVNFGGEKIVPVVGLSKGVKVKINFGQDKFLYNILGNVDISEQDKQNRLNKANELRMKEIEEEEARRKKEKEEEENTREEQANPLISMGYSKKKLSEHLKLLDGEERKQLYYGYWKMIIIQKTKMMMMILKNLIRFLI